VGSPPASLPDSRPSRSCPQTRRRADASPPHWPVGHEATLSANSGVQATHSRRCFRRAGRSDPAAIEGPSEHDRALRGPECCHEGTLRWLTSANSSDRTEIPTERAAVSVSSLRGGGGIWQIPENGDRVMPGTLHGVDRDAFDMSARDIVSSVTLPPGRARLSQGRCRPDHRPPQTRSEWW